MFALTRLVAHSLLSKDVLNFFLKQGSLDIYIANNILRTRVLLGRLVSHEIWFQSGDAKVKYFVYSTMSLGFCELRSCTSRVHYLFSGCGFLFTGLTALSWTGILLLLQAQGYSEGVRICVMTGSPAFPWAIKKETDACFWVPFCFKLERESYLFLLNDFLILSHGSFPLYTASRVIVLFPLSPTSWVLYKYFCVLILFYFLFIYRSVVIEW